MQSILRDNFASAKPVSTWASSFSGKIVLAFAATIILAIAAHLSVPLPFSPVPLTLAPFAVILLGMILGPATAFAAMIIYLTEGALGLPVFTPQGLGGVAQLLGPTGGYLFAYPLAAATAGWIARNIRILPSAFQRGLLAGMLSTSLMLACGAAWLAIILRLTLHATWQLAVAPFLPGEALKIITAALFFSIISHRWRQS